MTAFTSALRCPAVLLGLSDRAFLLAGYMLSVLLRLPVLLIEVTPTSNLGW